MKFAYYNKQETNPCTTLKWGKKAGRISRRRGIMVESIEAFYGTIYAFVILFKTQEFMLLSLLICFNSCSCLHTIRIIFDLETFNCMWLICFPPENSDHVQYCSDFDSTPC